MSEKNPWFEPGQPARPTDIKADKADLDMRLERKALAEGWDRTADKLDAAQSEMAALREELAKANEKIDQAWNRSHALDHKGFIPGALDAWKRPVPQHLPYDFSGNPGASATQYCNGWNDCGGYWSGHANDLQQRLAAAEQRNESLEDLLRRAKEWIASADCNVLTLAIDVFSGEIGDNAERLQVYSPQLLDDMRAALGIKPTESGASE